MSMTTPMVQTTAQAGAMLIAAFGTPVENNKPDDRDWLATIILTRLKVRLTLSCLGSFCELVSKQPAVLR